MKTEARARREGRIEERRRGEGGEEKEGGERDGQRKEGRWWREGRKSESFKLSP